MLKRAFELLVFFNIVFRGIKSIVLNILILDATALNDHAWKLQFNSKIIGRHSCLGQTADIFLFIKFI